jgi:hypothetical protein
LCCGLMSSLPSTLAIIWSARSTLSCARDEVLSSSVAELRGLSAPFPRTRLQRPACPSLVGWQVERALFNRGRGRRLLACCRPIAPSGPQDHQAGYGYQAGRRRVRGMHRRSRPRRSVFGTLQASELRARNCGCDSGLQFYPKNICFPASGQPGISGLSGEATALSRRRT